MVRSLHVPLSSVALLVFAGCSHVDAQELVVNGGLEQFRKCPTGPVTKRLKVDGTVKAAQGDPDLYSACSSSFGVPNNWSGSREAWEGDSYAGLVLTSDMPDECGMREYLQFPLVEPLENGRRYRLTIHVGPAQNTGYVTDRVGAVFSVDDRSRSGLSGKLRETPAIVNSLGRFLEDTSGWTTVTGVYNALGGERYVIIGNFHPCNRSSRKRLDPDRNASMRRKASMRMDPDPMRGAWQEWLSRTAYVYLDGISLIPDTSAPELIAELTQDLACRSDGRPAIGPELIPDPDFKRNAHPTPTSWRNASDGTPDLFDGVTGLYLYSAVDANNREYIRTPLADTLRPCTTYRISFDIRRDITYAYAVDAIGIAVTDTFTTRRNRERMAFPWTWRSPPGSFITNTDHTLTLCGEFTVPACATQLLLGNFDPDTSCTIIRTGNPLDGPYAYYFIDNVHLNAVTWSSNCLDTCHIGIPPPPSDRLSLQPGTERSVFHFDTDSTIPVDLNDQALEQLVAVLLADPTILVTIIGHADGSGPSQRNDHLALARAEQLRAFLVTRGVPSDRIAYRSPVADNGTEEGRRKNRRVEVFMSR